MILIRLSSNFVGLRGNSTLRKWIMLCLKNTQRNQWPKSWPMHWILPLVEILYLFYFIFHLRIYNLRWSVLCSGNWNFWLFFTSNYFRIHDGICVSWLGFASVCIELFIFSCDYLSARSNITFLSNEGWCGRLFCNSHPRIFVFLYGNAFVKNSDFCPKLAKLANRFQE